MSANARALEIILRARDDASKVVDGASKKMDRSFGGLSGSIKKLAVAAGGLYALKKGVDFIQEAATAATEDAVSVAALNQVMGNTGATDAQVAAMQKYVDVTTLATGIADDKLRPSLAILQAATKDGAKSQDLLNVAMDVSAGRKKDLKVVSEALAKAEQGNVAGLSKLGVATKDASGKTLSFDKIVENLRKTYKGAQQAISDADPWAVAQNAWGEAKEALGAGLLPIIKQAGQFAGQIMPMIGRLMTALGATIGKVLGKVMELFEKVWPYLEALIDGFVSFLSGPEGQGLIETAFEIIGGGVKVLKAIFDAVWPAVRQVVKIFVDWFKSPACQGLIRAVMDAVIAAVKLFKVIWDAVWPAIGPVLRLALKIITPVITAMVRIISGIITVVAKVIGWFTSLPGRVKGALAGAASWLRGIGEKILTGLKDGILAIWKTVTHWLGKLGTRVKGSISGAGRWLLDIGKAIITGLWNGIKGAISWLGDKITSIGGAVKGFFKKALGISSPSKLTREIGGFLPRGLALGIEDNLGMVDRAVRKMNGAVTGGSFSPSFAFSGAGVASGAGQSAGQVVHVHHIYLDGRELNRALGRTIVHDSRSGAA